MHPILVCLLACAALVPAAELPPPPPIASDNKWPAGVGVVHIPVSDGATQAARWFAAPGDGRKPLLVGLHTWSSTYDSAGGDAVYAAWCLRQGWHFLHPDFRGFNKTPASLASDRAVQDIVEAVAWAKKNASVDDARVYLVGVSGGGHMALVMAGRHPELWAGVSAWCGISDLARWHAEHARNGKPDRYAQNIESALGGPPDTEARRRDADRRSPLQWLKHASEVPLDIAAGIDDGHTGSVPFVHSLRAFNAVVPPADALPAADFESFFTTRKNPDGWPAAAPDPVWGRWPPLFRKTVGPTRITIFKGGHEIVHQAALNWLARQRRGQPVNWSSQDFIPLETQESKSGK